jgi:hypothetical protein
VESCSTVVGCGSFNPSFAINFCEGVMVDS